MAKKFGLVAGIFTFMLAAAARVVVAGDLVHPATAKPDEKGEVLFYDVRPLGVEGQGWSDVESPFDRLPGKAKDIVRPAVWNLARQSAGLNVRFTTDATAIHARWTLTNANLAMPHMPATGVSGVDLYVKAGDPAGWRWLAIGKPKEQTSDVALVKNLPAGRRDYMLYLPLYNGVTSVEIGIPKDAKLFKPEPRPADQSAPIVFYGTSITQGGCASRPGMMHTSILGRRLDRPVINLGFSGNGWMDLEVGNLLAELDPAVFVIDCLPNVDPKGVAERTAPLVRAIREKRPTTPILLVEDRTLSDSFLLKARMTRNLENRAALKKVYDELVAAGDKHLAYLSGENLLDPNGEDTVDGSHPTDLGFVHYADAFEPALTKLLADAPKREVPAASAPAASGPITVIRANQIGYLPDDPKIAILSSNTPQSGKFNVGTFTADIGRDQGAWGPFKHNYRLDFTQLRARGRYEIAAGETKSLKFDVGDKIYDVVAKHCRDFMRLQRCGAITNSVTGKTCHPDDAIDAETGKRVDLTGGWHDAADRIKHNITTSYCVAALQLMGETDEARHGLAYLRKIHPDADTIYVQVADDRDHGPPNKLWHDDQTDYGHGHGGPRSAWPALGKPQGPKHQNKSTGVASLAGRSAAAMALAGDIDTAKSLYTLGKKKPGAAMSVPVKAPYYYGESTWHDDMQWAAAELFIATKDDAYLDDAIAQAHEAAREPTWMGNDRHGHYEFFPYINLAHWRLAPHVDGDVKAALAGYYRTGLEKIRDRAMKNPYRLGTPLVWCSTNDVIAFATQATLYEQMTGDEQFRQLAAEARDWIFGRNPWGVSFVIGVPDSGNPSRHPHHLFYKLINQLPVGGLVDGPVYKDINDGLKFSDFGEDKYATFQSVEGGVFHDTYGDFSTNEPIIDGTVSLMFLMKMWETDAANLSPRR